MNILTILALIAKYGPTVVTVLEEYGPAAWAVATKVIDLVEASAKDGTLEADISTAVAGGKAFVAALGPLSSLKDLGDILSSVNQVDLGDPQPGDHTPSGSHR